MLQLKRIKITKSAPRWWTVSMIVSPLESNTEYIYYCNRSSYRRALVELTILNWMWRRAPGGLVSGDTIRGYGFRPAGSLVLEAWEGDEDVES